MPKKPTKKSIKLPKNFGKLKSEIGKEKVKKDLEKELNDLKYILRYFFHQLISDIARGDIGDRQNLEIWHMRVDQHIKPE